MFVTSRCNMPTVSDSGLKPDKQDVYAIYIRVSTGKQAEHGDSIEMQENLGRDIIQNNDGIFFRIYVEPAVSASKTKLSNRKVLQECLHDAKKGLFNKLIVYRRDRLARKIEDSLAVRGMLKDYNVDIVYSASGEMQSADDNDPYNKMLENIRASMDEIESAQTSMRVGDVMRDKAKRGEQTGGNLTYGYVRADKGKVVQVPEEIEIVHEIEDLYISGYGIYSIVRWLNGEKVRGIGIRPQGKAKRRKQIKSANENWTKDVVSSILFNPFYTGTMLYSKAGDRKRLKGEEKETMVIKAKGSHEPCRTEEKQERINRIKEQKASKVRSPRFYSTSFLLSGLLYCSECGRHFITRNTSRANKEPYLYYICSSSASNDCSRCSNVTFKKEPLEEYMISKIKERIAEIDIPELEDMVLNEMTKDDAKTREAIQECEKRITKRTKDYSAIRRLLLDLDEDDPNYELLKSSYQEDQAEILKELNDSKIKLASLEETLEINDDKAFNMKESVKKLKSFSASIESAPFYMRKMLLDEIVEKIEISKDGTVEVSFGISIPKSKAVTEKNLAPIDVGFMSFGGVGDKTSTKNITTPTVHASIALTSNFFEWSIDNYNKFKSGFKSWIGTLVPKDYKYVPYRHIQEKTGLSVYTCKSYFQYNILPRVETVQMICDKYGVKMEEFVEYCGLDCSIDSLQHLVDMVQSWSQKTRKELFSNGV